MADNVFTRITLSVFILKLCDPHLCLAWRAVDIACIAGRVKYFWLCSGRLAQVLFLNRVSDGKTSYLT